MLAAHLYHTFQPLLLQADCCQVEFRPHPAQHHARQALWLLLLLLLLPLAPPVLLLPLPVLPHELSCPVPLDISLCSAQVPANVTSSSHDEGDV